MAPRVTGYLGRAKSQSAELQMDNVKAALQLYYIDMAAYPDERAGLAPLVERPAGATAWNGPYLESAEGLTDPWGRPFLYAAPGAEGAAFTLRSLGRDGLEGGEGEDRDLAR